MSSLGKILIVDDNALNRTPIKYLLEKEGFEVFEACDGIEALDSVMINNPHVILLDIMMPNFNGHQVLAVLKSFVETQNIKVAIMSCKEPEFILSNELIVEHSADIYFVKPFSLIKMLDWIKQQFTS